MPQFGVATPAVASGIRPPQEGLPRIWGVKPEQRFFGDAQAGCLDHEHPLSSPPLASLRRRAAATKTRFRLPRANATCFPGSGCLPPTDPSSRRTCVRTRTRPPPDRTALPPPPGFRHAFARCGVHRARHNDLTGYSPGLTAPRAVCRLLRLYGSRAQPRASSATAAHSKRGCSEPRRRPLRDDASRAIPAQGQLRRATAPADTSDRANGFSPTCEQLGHLLSPCEPREPGTGQRGWPLGCQRHLVSNVGRPSDPPNVDDRVSEIAKPGRSPRAATLGLAPGSARESIADCMTRDAFRPWSCIVSDAVQTRSVPRTFRRVVGLRLLRLR